VGWGTTFFDYDNDGWMDLVVVNGHVYPQMAHVKMGGSASYQQRKLFYRNKRDGTFDEIGLELGEVFTEPTVSRGLGLGDLDNDGRMDLVVNVLDGTPQILHNEFRLPPSGGTFSTPGHWLLVKLEGSGLMTDAIGALIKVKTGEVTRTRLIRSGTSYLSQEDMRQHFGLGSAAKADSVEVLWPDGTTTVKKNVEADQLLVIKQSG
ncbi:MAG: CRTAC1 family protein, partial [Actinomycetia bacterium]|nr:CRTAC1 family protein [Actinomycetes bacterium]